MSKSRCQYRNDRSGRVQSRLVICAPHSTHAASSSSLFVMRAVDLLFSMPFRCDASCPFYPAIPAVPISMASLLPCCTAAPHLGHMIAAISQPDWRIAAINCQVPDGDAQQGGCQLPAGDAAAHVTLQLLLNTCSTLVGRVGERRRVLIAMRTLK